jgi:hypothetical protein
MTFAIRERLTAHLALGLGAALLAGCTTLSHTNKRLDPDGPPHTTPLRATLSVDGLRGNKKVLMFLALSGGGSRAAYLSTATMLRLQTVFPEVDLLGEVDAMSAVSGGSLAAAYYALSRDEVLRNPDGARALAPLALPPDGIAKLEVDAQRGEIRCKEPLDGAEIARVAQQVAPRIRFVEAVAALCNQGTVKGLRVWDETTVRDQISRDFLRRWIGNWFWPSNIARYWFTAYDRSDIMAQTLADNLFDSPVIGRDLEFGDLNPTRPYLILNATNATEQSSDGAGTLDEYPFGGVFTFTEQDFTTRLNSDIRSYSVARAVMASSAFPLVFPSMTMRDFRGKEPQVDCSYDTDDDDPVGDAARAAEKNCLSYLHVFDGGNSDNLGLKSIKRVLFRMALDGSLQQYSRVVVLLVDAFAKPGGTPRTDADPRTLLGLLLDTNLVDAVDSLLQTNRANLIAEFQDARLGWSIECSDDLRSLPRNLCDRLGQLGRRLNLADKMVFYHFGFDDVEDFKLKRQLDRIPTSFRISSRDKHLIDQAVSLVINDKNVCLRQIQAVILDEQRVDARAANAACRGMDVVPKAREVQER